MNLVSTYFDYLDHMYAYLSTPLVNSEDPQIDALGGDSLCSRGASETSGSGRIESRGLIKTHPIFVLRATIKGVPHGTPMELGWMISGETI